MSTQDNISRQPFSFRGRLDGSSCLHIYLSSTNERNWFSDENFDKSWHSQNQNTSMIHAKQSLVSIGEQRNWYLPPRVDFGTRNDLPCGYHEIHMMLIYKNGLLHSLVSLIIWNTTTLSGSLFKLVVWSATTYITVLKNIHGKDWIATILNVHLTSTGICPDSNPTVGKQHRHTHTFSHEGQ